MNHWLVYKPRSAGATARVWEIADQVTRETGQVARRKDVIERYVAEGGNPNTASTQYHYWRHAQEGNEEGETEKDANIEAVRLTVAGDGRLVIPAEMRRAMQIDASGRVTARVVNGELRVVSAAMALAQARDLVRAFDQGQGSPVDELIRERRAEAERE